MFHEYILRFTCNSHFLKFKAMEKIKTHSRDEFAKLSQACIMADISTRTTGQQELDGQAVMQHWPNRSQKIVRIHLYLQSSKVKFLSFIISIFGNRYPVCRLLP